MTATAPPTFGLMVNMGGQTAPDTDGVVQLACRQAQAAEDLGYHDVWLTEHHFIHFGINPSALTTAGYLLGATRRIRIGTAVTLSPLLHPVDLAERSSLLAHLGQGRFDLGLGRGGYVLDYRVFGIDTARWDDEPAAAVEAMRRLWAGESVDASDPDGPGIQPPPPAAGPPPLFVASGSSAALGCAAANGLALQHYFPVDAASRVEVEQRYRDLGGAADINHVHTLIALVSDAPEADRARLAAALTASFRAGDHAGVPQRPAHVDPGGARVDPADMAAHTAQGAIVGSPAQVTDEIGRFIDVTGARRLVVYAEAIADEAATMRSIERFAADVMPHFSAA